MTDRFKFFFGQVENPVENPKDVMQHLPKGHWKKGHSAYELAHSWVRANGIPEPVAKVLRQAEEFRGMELIEGIFEKKTKLRPPVRGPSHTDLLALIGDGNGCVVLGVEGKVNEGFGKVVSKWLNGASEGKKQRLSGLRETLQLEDSDAQNLRYQLLHRTAATIYEAQSYKVCKAVMLVHSFSEKHKGFDDFRKFAEAIKAPVSCRNKLSEEVTLEGVALRLAWVADRVCPETAHR